MYYFSHAYFNAMDRSYYPPTSPAEEAALRGEGPDMKLNPSEIGISAPPMQDQLRALETRIKQGATRVELGFTGAGKGSMQRGATTPEMYGREERRDIKELATFNKITLSTHASPSAGSLAGLGQGGFDESAREKTLNEIKRAIDFASDTTHGGAVVVHTTDFPRAISEAFPEFKAYKEEPEKALLYIVDDRTGQLIQMVRKNVKQVLPDWEKDPQTGGYIYVDEEKKIRKPKFNPETKRPVMKEYDWEFFEKEAKELSEKEGRKITPEEAYIRVSYDMQQEYHKGWALQFGTGYHEALADKEKVQKALEFYEKLESSMPEEEKWKLRRQLPSAADRGAGFVPPEVKMPVGYLKDRLREVDLRLEYYRQGSVGSEQNAQRLEMDKQHMLPIRDYAEEKIADTVARAGIFAMQKTQAKQLKEPLYVSPENIFPEQYGGHPEELKKEILGSRKEMMSQLEERGYSKEKAKQFAEEHIKATFDIGHAYTWRKYFNEDPDKTYEENTKEFNKWLFKQIDDLNTQKIIGHIHVSDNFGFEDEHVTPGQGIVPIKEFIEKMKKAGIKDIVVEPAHQDYRAMLGGWTTFGSGVYGIMAAGRRESWADIEHSYFGRTAPPYFLYGQAAPDPEHWTLWSGQRME